MLGILLGATRRARERCLHGII